jgi:hypothetical protein
VEANDVSPLQSKVGSYFSKTEDFFLVNSLLMNLILDFAISLLESTVEEPLLFEVLMDLL